MKFTHTLAAAKTVEERTWAVADGLAQDFKDAAVTPGVLDFKNAVEALKEKGHTYDPVTIGAYWRVASTFGLSRRKKGTGVKVYAEIISPLWPLLNPETRTNDLVAYAAQFFASGTSGALAARQWAKAQANALRAEKKAAEEAEQKAAYRKQLKMAEENLANSIKTAKRPQIKAALRDVNNLRRLLGMDLLMVDFEEEEPTAKKDEESTAKQQEEAAKKKKEEERRYALSLWEKDLAVLSIKIREVGNTYSRVREDLNEDDREAAVADLDRMVARIQVLRNDLSGSINEDDLQAALADWSSES